MNLRTAIEAEVVALQAIAKAGSEIRKVNPDMTVEQSRARAMSEQPALYDAWREARRRVISMGGK